MELWTLVFAGISAIGVSWQIWDRRAHRPMALWSIWQSDDLRNFALSLEGDATAYSWTVVVRAPSGSATVVASGTRLSPGDPAIKFEIELGEDIDPSDAWMVMSWITHSPRRGERGRQWIRTNLATGERQRYQRKLFRPRKRWRATGRRVMPTTPELENKAVTVVLPPHDDAPAA